MTSDRLDRIDLLLYLHAPEHWAMREILNLMSEELRYLHNRPPAQQVVDSGQELLKEQN